MEFGYEAKNEDDEKITGTVEADSKGAALLKLQQRGLYVFSIEEKEQSLFEKDINLDLSFFQRVKDDDIIMFSRQLAIMLESQIGVIESLRILAEQIEKKTFREVVEDIADQVEEGKPFSKALESHDDVFSSFYVGAIESGEVSGNIPQSLRYLEDHMRQNAEFKKKLIGAAIYPIFIIFVFSAVVAFLLIYVIPDIVVMIEDLDAEMPAITQFVVSTSDFIVNWGVHLVIGIIALGFGFMRLLKTEEGKRVFDKTILEIPVLGGFLKKIYVTYFAESLSTLITSGLDIVKALEITERVVGNEIYKDLVKEAREDVKEGEELSTSLEKHSDYFPKLMTQMITVGERTGEMKNILDSVIKFYRDQIERGLDTFVSLAEPTLIVLLGGVVGGLVLSVLLPIYEVGMSM